MARARPAKRILLVEGSDDEHFVQHFCKRCGIDESFSIVNKSGFPNLRSAIPVEVKAPGRRVVGILADADANVNGRWKEIVGELVGTGIKAQKPRRPTGTVIEGKPRVGIWLMPDNRTRGELEDFVRKLIPQGDPVWPLATRYIGAIPESDHKFQRHKTLKAEVHAWLAAQKRPGRMGPAVSSGALTTDGVPLASDFAKWLRDLFRR
ncbi:MAG: hypothetical protein OXG83_11230 [Acidobacteria bacterium]|nr:hypothetical protein [Acidobacteriota bacterium]